MRKQAKQQLAEGLAKINQSQLPAHTIPTCNVATKELQGLHVRDGQPSQQLQQEVDGHAVLLLRCSPLWMEHAGAPFETHHPRVQAGEDSLCKKVPVRTGFK